MSNRTRTNQELQEEISLLKERIAELERSRKDCREIEETPPYDKELLRGFLERTADSVFIKDRDGRYLFLNAQAARVMGQSATDITGKDDTFLFPPDEARRIMEHDRTIMDGKAVATYEEVLTTLSGEERTFLATKGPLFDARGNLRGIFGMARDITERKRAEEALKESEKRFHAIADYSYNWETWIAPDGSLIWTSPSIYALSGYTVDEYMAMRSRPVPIAHEDDREMVDEIFRTALLGGVSSGLEFRIRCKDGSVKWVAVSYQPIYSADGAHLGLRSSVHDVTARRMAEEALDRERRFMEGLIRTAQVIILILDPEGRIVSFNPYMEKLSGHRLEEVKGRSWFSTCLPEEEKTVRGLFERAIAGESTSSNVNAIRLRDGGTRYIEWHDTTLRDDRGGITGLLCVGIDITDRMEAEEALKDSERRFRAIANYSYDWESWVDADGKLLWASPSIFALTGYTADECMTMPEFPLPIIHEADREKLDREFKDAVLGLTDNDVEFRIRCKDGSTKWASVSYQPIFDAGGVRLGHRSSVRDITDRKEMQETLRESEERYRSIFENSPLGIFQSTFDGRYIKVNPALALMLGYKSPREVTDSVQNIAGQIYAKPDRRDEMIRRAMMGGTPVIFEDQFLRKDGQKWVGRLSFSVIRDETGAPHHVEGIVGDITEKKKMEERLKSTTRSLRILSHRLLEVQEMERRSIARELHDEIGQNLTALRLNLKRVERTESPADLGDSLDIVDSLINEVRRMSIELRPSILDDFGLVAALDWYINWLAGRAGFTALFNTEVTEEDRLSPVIEVTCYRIVQEALTNVVRHSHAQKAWVELKKQNGELHLMIRDDGEGFNVENVQKGASKGQSFGLIGMRERAVLAGGRIEFTSHPGKGTQIHAYFPIES